MSYGIMLEKKDGEVVVTGVSGIDNVPDRITISGHTHQGPGSSGDSIQAAASTGVYASAGSPGLAQLKMRLEPEVTE